MDPKDGFLQRRPDRQYLTRDDNLYSYDSRCRSSRTEQRPSFLRMHGPVHRQVRGAFTPGMIRILC